MTLVIDCHGHYTTAPEPHNAWREAQKAAFKAGEPAPAYPTISDDEKYLCRVTLPNVVVTSGTPQVGGPDVVTQSVSFRARDNGTDAGIKVEYQNVDSTV